MNVILLLIKVTCLDSNLLLYLIKKTTKLNSNDNFLPFFSTVTDAIPISRWNVGIFNLCKKKYYSMKLLGIPHNLNQHITLFKGFIFLCTSVQNVPYNLKKYTELRIFMYVHNCWYHSLFYILSLYTLDVSIRRTE